MKYIECIELKFKDMQAEVMLVACDYVNRDFQKRLEKNSNETFNHIEDCIIKHRSKLASALAK